jgi:hypothetical protein
MRAIASQAVELTLSLGGSVGGEHGDGLSRSNGCRRCMGVKSCRLFARKHAADPHNLLNPGKIVNALPMDTNRVMTRHQAHIWTRTSISVPGGLEERLNYAMERGLPES